MAPLVSQAQRAWMHANKPAMAARWEKETPKGAKLPRHVKGKKKYKIVVKNGMKDKSGVILGQMDPNTKKIKINVKARAHKDKRELASTIKHELMHVKHPKMTEKEVYKKTAKTKISESEQRDLLKKLHRATITGREGALRKKYKIAPGKVEPGAIFNKAKEMSRNEAQQSDGVPVVKRVAISGLV